MFIFIGLISLARRDPVIYHRRRVGEHYLQAFPSGIGPGCEDGPVENRRVDGAGGNGFSVLGIREGYP